MKNKRGLNSILSSDRKALCIVLGIVMISVLTLTVVYAALSTTLNISGNAEVSSASWDIHLDNVQLNSSSTTTTAPTITDSRTATFSTTLSKPGDFYEFTIDVVNNGSIDAMIDSVTKTPELSDTQKKYLNYIVEYQNGQSITTKQLVSKNSFVRLKVKLKFRKDLTASDLPTQSETLNLSFTVNYVQADETGSNVTDNGVRTLYNVVSGDLNTVGSEICIGAECFYLMKNDGEYVTMLAKYNLYVGNSYDGNENYTVTPLENPTGKQAATSLGALFDSEGSYANFPWKGTVVFSTTNYWLDSNRNSFKTSYQKDFDVNGTFYPYVYDSNSSVYTYVNNYKAYLEVLGVGVEEARLIKGQELIELGCSAVDSKCTSAPEWVYGTSYWTGTASSFNTVWLVNSRGGFYSHHYSVIYGFCVRPVIKISLSEF